MGAAETWSIFEYKNIDIIILLAPKLKQRLRTTVVTGHILYVYWNYFLVIYETFIKKNNKSVIYKKKGKIRRQSKKVNITFFV